MSTIKGLLLFVGGGFSAALLILFVYVYCESLHVAQNSSSVVHPSTTEGLTRIEGQPSSGPYIFGFNEDGVMWRGNTETGDLQMLVPDSTSGSRVVAYAHGPIPPRVKIPTAAISRIGVKYRIKEATEKDSAALILAEFNNPTEYRVSQIVLEIDGAKYSIKTDMKASANWATPPKDPIEIPLPSGTMKNAQVICVSMYGYSESVE